MLTQAEKQRYYKALPHRNPEYEGIFYVGVITTGVFCHATCPARKPKFENCEFFENAQTAVLAGFRPCQRCQPLSPPQQVSPMISKPVKDPLLNAAWLDTPLGPMLALADDHKLYLLEFIERRDLEREVERLRKPLKIAIIPGETAIIQQITGELRDYFAGKFFIFKTPCHLMGSPFQQKVWRALQKIPLGETRSYLRIAQAIHQPTACRAVAQANGANQLALIIPCHRVINANGELGGYGGGINRKAWLLAHECKKIK